MTRLNLTVIRSADIHRSADFYRNFDLEFELHSHGKGPPHFATLNTKTVFEIYPATEKMPVSKSTRIGFEVQSCEMVIKRTLEKGYDVVSMPKESPWGLRAVVKDPDGHSVEIISQTKIGEV